MMTMMRIALASAALALCVTGAAQAQDYPSQPVKLVVPFPAGGGTDALARWFAKGLEAKFGQPFVVENRAGSGTTLGAGFVARAAPDGYTIMLGTSSTYAIAPNVYKKVPFDTAKDFAPIALVAEVPFVLVVNPALPVQIGGGAGGAGARQARRDELRLGRDRHPASRQCGAAQDAHRH